MQPVIIGIGEILWDLLPTGPRMGGAPANFACHAHALGADARIVSQVGEDPAGARLLRKLEEIGVPTNGISVSPEFPTGAVGVEIGADGQPNYAIVAEVAWDHLTVTPGNQELLENAAAVCFGTLAQRMPASASAIRELVSFTPADALRVFDVNLRQDYYSVELIVESLRLANVLKINENELPEISRMFGITGGVREQIAGLFSMFDLNLIAFTRGDEGSVLFDGSEWCEHPGIAAVVVDTVGAGDSFTAAVTLGLLKQWPLAAISDAANQIAAFVCSQAGAIPPIPDLLRSLFTIEGPVVRPIRPPARSVRAS